MIVPAANFEEAALVKNMNIFAISHLRELSGYPNWRVEPRAVEREKNTKRALRDLPDLPDIKDIKGQPEAKRALQIAAAGGHHMLLVGPPGVGKTMLAKAFAGILPALSEEEMFEVMQIYSCAGLLPANEPLIKDRPFRQVHSASTLLALIGGGALATPGEISLAHRGVLFLDEIAEFPRSHLESLRQPLEEKIINISRHESKARYPARFIMIAGMNPCPCGYFGDPQKECRCRPYQIIHYQRKLSGPILDRMDITVELQRQSLAVFRQEQEESSADIREKITKARLLQKNRTNSGTELNGDMSPAQLKKYCRLQQDSEDFLIEGGEKLFFSGRNYHQTIKLARTIADLNSHEAIEQGDLAEALQYRRQ